MPYPRSSLNSCRITASFCGDKGHTLKKVLQSTGTESVHFIFGLWYFSRIAAIGESATSSKTIEFGLGEMLPDDVRGADYVAISVN